MEDEGDGEIGGEIGGKIGGKSGGKSDGGSGSNTDPPSGADGDRFRHLGGLPRVDRQIGKARSDLHQALR
jgi:hypothetical protein